jgi:hypothetical protein
MIERATTLRHWPPRRSLYDRDEVVQALPVEAAQARAILASAVQRPPLAVYPQLSDVLQLHLHRVLAGRVQPAHALADAATAMRQTIDGAARAAAWQTPGGAPFTLPPSWSPAGAAPPPLDRARAVF